VTRRGWKFKSYRHLTDGGMAEVHVGGALGPDGRRELCAIKRLLPEFRARDEYLDMFRREAAIGAQIDHPNVVRFVAQGELDESPCLALEYVHGVNVRELVTACRKSGVVLPIGLSAYIMAQIAKALAHIHAAADAASGRPLGIVHRDISPANLLVGFDGRVRLADFGVGRSNFDAVRTQTGIVKGKYCYMSPEQIAGAQLDARSDLFAFGAVLWELVAGRRTFDDASEALVVGKVAEGKLPGRLREFSAVVDPELEAVTERCLAADRERRYKGAGQIAMDLQAYLRQRHPGTDESELQAFLGLVLPVTRAGREELLAGARNFLANAEFEAAEAPRRAAFAPDAPPAVPPVPMARAVGMDVGRAVASGDEAPAAFGAFTGGVDDPVASAALGGNAHWLRRGRDLSLVDARPVNLRLSPGAPRPKNQAAGIPAYPARAPSTRVPTSRPPTSARPAASRAPTRTRRQTKRKASRAPMIVLGLLVLVVVGLVWWFAGGGSKLLP
jgi:hypothetical protein